MAVRAWAPLVGALVLAAPACSDPAPPAGSVPFTPDGVAGVVKDDLLGHSPRLVISSIACGPFATGGGDVGGCTIDLSGTKVTYVVTRVERRFTVRPTAPILDVDASAATLAQTLIEQSATPILPTVDCGTATAVQGPAGTEVPCTVADAGPTARRFVLIIGEDGTARAEERRLSTP